MERRTAAKVQKRWTRSALHAHQGGVDAAARQLGLGGIGVGLGAVVALEDGTELLLDAGVKISATPPAGGEEEAAA